MMRASVLLAIGALLLSCGGGEGRTYDNSDLQLAPAFGAKAMCSCLFVMERDEEYCRVWTRQTPAVADFRIDREKKMVESGALFFWMERARYVDDTFGCVLDE